MNRRGVAMLLVLVVLVVAVTAAVNVSRVSVSGMLAETAARDRALADDLLAQGEQLAIHWLRASSPTAVLPPDADRPTFLIAHNIIRSEANDRPRKDRTLTISATDLTGMIPLRAIGRSSGSRLATDVPADVRRSLEAIDLQNASIGPDMLDPARLERPRFPQHRPASRDDETSSETEAESPNAHRLVFSPSGSDDNEDPAQSSGDPTDEHPPASCCEIIAFLSPSPPERRTHRNKTNEEKTIPLNVNTTPIDLLRTALAQAGLDAIDEIVKAREKGQAAPLNLSVENDSPVRFTTRSPLWGCRIDARVGSVSRGRWIVFEQSGGAWRPLRRIIIDG